MQRVSALWQASPRKLVGALFILMLAAMMAVASGASFTSTSANVGNIVTAGTLTHSNTTPNADTSILKVDNLMPGHSADGYVTIGNTGDGEGAFTLTKSALVDLPASPAFSNKLKLVIDDVTIPSAPVNIYDGTLGSMPAQDMGDISAGSTRDYKFTVEFPDGGKPSGPATGDNRFKNASTTVTFDWESVSN
jgi:spore coat-associated protein N